MMNESNFPEEFDWKEDAETPEVIPTEETLAEKVPVDEIPAEKIPVEEIPAEEPPAAEIPEDEVIPEILSDIEIFAGDAALSEQFSEEDALHEELSDPQVGDELMAADHAMYSAGLQHPEDREFLFEDTLLLVQNWMPC